MSYNPEYNAKTMRRAHWSIDPAKGTHAFAELLKELPSDAVIETAGKEMAYIKADCFGLTESSSNYISLAFVYNDGASADERFCYVRLATSRDAEIISGANISGGFFVWDDTTAGEIINQLESMPDFPVKIYGNNFAYIDDDGDPGAPATFALFETSSRKTFDLRVVGVSAVAENYRQLDAEPEPQIHVDTVPFEISGKKPKGEFKRYPVSFGIRSVNQQDVWDRTRSIGDEAEWRHYDSDKDIGSLEIRHNRDKADDNYDIKPVGTRFGPPGAPDAVKFGELPWGFTHADGTEGETFLLDNIRAFDMHDADGFAVAGGADLVKLYLSEEFHPGYDDPENGLSPDAYAFGPLDAPGPGLIGDLAFEIVPNRIRDYFTIAGDSLPGQDVFRVSAGAKYGGQLGYLAMVYDNKDADGDNDRKRKAVFFESSRRFNAGNLMTKVDRRRSDKRPATTCLFSLEFTRRSSWGERLPKNPGDFLFKGARLLIDRWAHCNHRTGPYESLVRA